MPRGRRKIATFLHRRLFRDTSKTGGGTNVPAREPGGRNRADKRSNASHREKDRHRERHNVSAGEFWPQVWSTAKKPISAPKCLGSAAMVRNVSLTARNRIL